jgi:DNA helicase IV
MTRLPERSGKAVRRYDTSRAHGGDYDSKMTEKSSIVRARDGGMTIDAGHVLESFMEQCHFDKAAIERERRRELVPAIPGVAANKGAAERCARYSRNRLAEMAEDTEQVAVGRIDTLTDEAFYLGYELIRNEAGEVLVVNWQAPVAAAYYKAHAADPHGLRRKRVFDCAGNLIRGFTDTDFNDSTSARATLDDALLADLRATRTGELRDIVATIQAAQYEVIEAPLDQLTVIQGGPGTGKTAIALHRVSWLLYNHQQLDPADVLVLGPNRTFIQYIEGMLPGLGDQVTHLSIDELRPEMKTEPSIRGTESDDVAAIKGDARMAALLARLLVQLVKAPSVTGDWEVRTRGETFSLNGPQVADAVRRALAPGGPYNHWRARLRAWFKDTAELAKAQRMRWPEPADAAMLVDRILPPESPTRLVQRLFASGERLRDIGRDLFTDDDLTLLHRSTASLHDELWTVSDMFLIDEAAELISGPPPRYQHVVVDEAQDLSPMQLRAVARRSYGSMTIVGDIAQSTGLWTRDDWDEVICHLPNRLPVVRHTLRYGYRVPRQIHELAAVMTPDIAPGIEAPQAVRDGDEDPATWRSTGAGLGDRIVEQIRRHTGDGLSVGIISPTAHRETIENALADKSILWNDADDGDLGAGVTLVSPQGAKGLEFDAVVVVDPDQIERGNNRGDRLLYIALTRATQRLDVIELELGVEQLERHIVDTVAGEVVRRIELASPQLWSAILEAVAHTLEQR